MFLTLEDYKKIESWLKLNSKKDTDFDFADSIDGSETIAIVQGNKNKKIFLRDFINEIGNIFSKSFVNVSADFGLHGIALETAIQAIPLINRKKGLVITFEDTDSNWRIYQFIGELTLWNLVDLWQDVLNWESFAVDSLLPDEEDITATESDGKGNAKLKFADKEYNPDSFSGLGHVILRKNLIEVTDLLTGKSRGIVNFLHQDRINKENTIYEIKYDFDLNGESIEIPKDCVLKFNGGSLYNGSIKLNNTELTGLPKINCTIISGSSIKNEYANVCWFGAINDGIFDNTEKFNELFNIFLNIYLPKGRYKCGDVIINGIKYGLKIHGENKYLHRFDVDTCTYIDYTGNNYWLTASLNVAEIFNLEINVKNTSKGAFLLNKFLTSSIHDVNFDTNSDHDEISSTATAITISGDGYNTSIYNIFARYYNIGIHIKNTLGTKDWLNNITIGRSKGDVYLHTLNYGIVIEKGSDVLLFGTAIENTKKEGVSIKNVIKHIDSVSVICEYCYFENLGLDNDCAFSSESLVDIYSGNTWTFKNCDFHTVNTQYLIKHTGAESSALFENNRGINISPSLNLKGIKGVIFDTNSKVNSAFRMDYADTYSTQPYMVNEEFGFKFNQLESPISVIGRNLPLNEKSYSTGKTSLVSRIALSKDWINKMRDGSWGGTMWIPLYECPINNDNGNVYHIKMLLNIVPGDLNTESVMDNILGVSVLDFWVYPLGGYAAKNKLILLGEEVYNLFGFKEFYIDKPSKESSSLFLCIDGYDGLHQDPLEYNLIVTYEIECYGHNKLIYKNQDCGTLYKLQLITLLNPLTKRIYYSINNLGWLLYFGNNKYYDIHGNEVVV